MHNFIMSLFTYARGLTVIKLFIKFWQTNLKKNIFEELNFHIIIIKFNLICPHKLSFANNSMNWLKIVSVQFGW